MTPTPHSEPDNVDEILRALVQYHKQQWRVSGPHDDIEPIDLPAAKSALLAYSDKRLQRFADCIKLAMADGKSSHSVKRINEIVEAEHAAALKSRLNGGKT